MCISFVEFHDVFHAPNWRVFKVFKILIDNFLVLSAFIGSAQRFSWSWNNICTYLTRCQNQSCPVLLLSLPKRQGAQKSVNMHLSRLFWRLLRSSLYSTGSKLATLSSGAELVGCLTV